MGPSLNLTYHTPKRDCPFHQILFYMNLNLPTVDLLIELGVNVLLRVDGGALGKSSGC